MKDVYTYMHTWICKLRVYLAWWISVHASKSKRKGFLLLWPWITYTKTILTATSPVQYSNYFILLNQYLNCWVCFEFQQSWELLLIGWPLPTRSSRPAAAAHDSCMKQATVDVKSPTAITKKQERVVSAWTRPHCFCDLPLGLSFSLISLQYHLQVQH